MIQNTSVSTLTGHSNRANFLITVIFSTPETIRGTSFQRNNFWNGLVGKALLMIGLWLPWIPTTNHN